MRLLFVDLLDSSGTLLSPWPVLQVSLSQLHRDTLTLRMDYISLDSDDKGSHRRCRFRSHGETAVLAKCHQRS